MYKTADSSLSASVSKVIFKMEQKLSLSTHILDTTKGKPADNVKVKFFKLVGEVWVESTFDGATDKDGRIRDFTKVDAVTCGVYKLRFEVAEYFQRLGVDTLYPFIEVSRYKTIFQLATEIQKTPFQISFEITSESHYHIPLLLNPFGYSTYRGS